MQKSDMIWLASKAVAKKWDFETLKYSDDLYTKDYLSIADEVWEYVEECEKIGTTAFYEKYKEFKLYP